jgi:hypothetical protein
MGCAEKRFMRASWIAPPGPSSPIRARWIDAAGAALSIHRWWIVGAARLCTIRIVWIVAPAARSTIHDGGRGASPQARAIHAQGMIGEAGAIRIHVACGDRFRGIFLPRRAKRIRWRLQLLSLGDITDPPPRENALRFMCGPILTMERTTRAPPPFQQTPRGGWGGRHRNGELSMARDFFPRRDSEALAFTANFRRHIVAQAEVLQLPPEMVSRYVELQEQFARPITRRKAPRPTPA